MGRGREGGDCLPLLTVLHVFYVEKSLTQVTLYMFQENSYEKKEISFDTTSRCNSPLVKTDNVKSWYSEVEGCGVQCQNPLFTEEEHDEVHIFIAVFGSLCLVCTLFTMVGFKFNIHFKYEFYFFLKGMAFEKRVWRLQRGHGAMTHQFAVNFITSRLTVSGQINLLEYQSEKLIKYFFKLRKNKINLLIQIA